MDEDLRLKQKELSTTMQTRAAELALAGGNTDISAPAIRTLSPGCTQSSPARCQERCTHANKATRYIRNSSRNFSWSSRTALNTVVTVT